jgi:predicted  nucleic acid-binding Zn-ribbon protein
VNNLGQQQKLDVFLRHRQEAQWNEFKNTITSQITDEKSHAIERELQLTHELHDVINKKISTRWEQSSDRGERVEQSTTTPMEGVAIDGTTKPTNEEFSQNLESSGGLDQSWHAPNMPTIESSMPVNSPDDCQHSNIGRNSRDPPTGPRVWREKMARKSRRSKTSNSMDRNGSTQNSRLLQLDAEISNLKDTITEKESRKPKTSRHMVISEQGWTQIQ